MAETTIPRCGDTVQHHPTGEEWLVAYADPARDELAWCGWPPGVAKLSDCTLVRRCSDEEHAALVAQILRMPAHRDHRPDGVRRMHPEVARG